MWTRRSSRAPRTLALGSKREAEVENLRGRRGSVSAVIAAMAAAMDANAGRARAEDEASEDAILRAPESESEGGEARDASAASSVSVAAPPPAPPADVAVYGSMHNDTLAYTIKYPVSVGSGDDVRWVTTRPPEKYSSAPPLTTDARQRVVYEAISFKDALTATVSVGPPAPESPLLAVLEDANGNPTPVRPEDVRVKDFVLAVLLDRVAAPRRPDGTRSTIARLEEYERVPSGRGGGATDESRYYFRYIYTVDYPSSYSEGPGAGPRTRRIVASTALRDGYLYTYSLSCPVTRWEEYGESIVNAVNDFEIDAAADARSKPAYVSPESAPWAIF